MQARLQGPAWRHPIALMILTSLVIGACSAAPAVSPITTPSVSPTATPSPAASAVTSCTVITRDEAATVLGIPVTGAFSGGEDIAGTLRACGFDTAQPDVRLSVAVVANGQAQFEQLKAATPHSAPLSGVGDEAFAADESGAGGGPFLVGAVKGGTAVYLFKGYGTATQFEAMKTLLATAVTRI
jgi:hypothetical protein